MLAFTAAVAVQGARQPRRPPTSTRHAPPPVRAAPARSHTRAPTMSAAPAQVVPSPLPRVWVYDHCPFACRVRYALGMKNVKHTVMWLANDDVDTPTGLVGKKVVPIFESHGAEGGAVMESMDICLAVDADPRYGLPGCFAPATGRADIGAWFDATKETVRRLTRPRVVNLPVPEFVFADARAAFVRNHPLPEPSSYDENLANTEALLAEVQPRVQALSDMIHSEEFCSEGGLSFDDVDLFPKLRTLTVVKGLTLTPKILGYLKYHSERSQVGTYERFAA